MARNQEIAIGMYERSAALFARYAETEPLLLGRGAAPEWAEEAGKLALGGDQAEGIAARAPLLSLLGHVHGEKKKGYYQPQPISSESVLPIINEPTTTDETLRRIWDGFTHGYKQMSEKGKSLDVQEANYLSLLQRYCWAVPAPVADGQPRDVSLYDYTRVSAALAVCMTGAEDEEPALLVGGDVSGVQDWLYALSSSGVAKGLRGRSFYLQLLAEVIALYVLEELGLPSCNLLYAGGGNFYLLAPLASAGKLAEIQRAISRKLLRMHEGALYVALGFSPLSRAMLTGRDAKVGDAWDAVTQALNRNKARRFFELDDTDMTKAIGTPMAGTGKLRDTCGVCRRTIVDPAEGNDLEDGSRKCAQCVSFEELGNQLRDAEYLVVSRVQATDGVSPITGWRQGLAQFGHDIQLMPAASHNTRSWQDRKSDLVRIYYWKTEPNMQEFPGHVDSVRAAWIFRPLAQCTPINQKQEIATFDELKSKGIERWGVLRMDVDNLGKIFQEGIPASSLSRVVGLSGLLRLYFEGHVPQLAQKYNRDKDGKSQPRIYLMYAGGDDLFIVGGWSDLPHLAHDIQQDFAKFACENSKLTISGGISIALDTKYPLYQAARQAGDAEHQAKHQRGDAKNALAFLGEVMGWGEEYDRVKNRVDDLMRWLDDEEGKLPRTFLMTLRAIDAEWREWKESEKDDNGRYTHKKDETLFLGPWQWHLIYSVARAGERSRNLTVRDEVQKFAESIVGNEITTLGVIARWTELSTRRKDER